MYTYQNLLDDYNRLIHAGVGGGHIGESECGRMIPYLHLGSAGGPQIIIQGAIHAREWPTAKLIVCQIDALRGADIGAGGIYFVPMSNPDGNAIVEGVQAPRAGFETGDPKLYKANVNGVDLNTNFDAQWGHGQHNVRIPAASDYIGSAPFSERETRALADFTRTVRPVFTLSYHAKGREVYYLFNQDHYSKVRDRKIAVCIAERLGYRLIEEWGGLGYPKVSCGGYKDWCIDTLGIPSVTVEIISDDYEHPLTDVALAPDVAVNLDLPLRILEVLNYK